MPSPTSFNRFCRLRIGSSEDANALDVSNLRIQFEIVKSSIGKPNTATIKVFNLSESSRSKIQQFDRVVLEAGYEGSNGTIFSGEVFNVFPRRLQPEWVIEIYASDGGFNFREAYTTASYGNNVSLSQILDGLRGDMNLEVGQINLSDSVLNSKKIMGWQFTGDTSKALDELKLEYNFDWSIQGGKFYVIARDRTADAKPVFEINSESGMIGSPVLTERGADVKTLLNWQLIPNEEINVVSVGQPIKYAYLNISSAKQRINYGNFIVRQITHIGDTRGLDWYTMIEGYDRPPEVI